MNEQNTHAAQKAVIVISSHVVRGTVGNRAAVFALEAMGFPVWALQTITLPWHPGHGLSTRIVPDSKQFDSVINDLCNAPWLSEVGGVISGYIGHPSQARSIAKLVGTLKEQAPETRYLCDPVIGDQSGLYVPDATAHGIKEHLLPLADITTPNRFELAWLSNADLSDNNQIVKAAQALGPGHLLVTSSFGMMRNNTANLMVSAQNTILAEHRMLDAPINGPGDLTSALTLAHFLNGLSEEDLLKRVTGSVFDILNETIRHGSDELLLERSVSSLFQPKAPVQMRKLLIKD